jgi:hypothetical protein
MTSNVISKKKHWRSEMNTSRFDEAVECLTDLCQELLASKEDFVDVEVEAVALGNNILRRAIAQALERFDDELFESKTLSGKVKGREKRTVLSLCGEITFYRRRYQRSEGSYLPLDEILALTPRSRLSPAATFELCSLALDLSYQKTADAFKRRSGITISKPVVGEAIVASASALGFENAVEKKKAIRTLCCEADGIWVSLQHTKARRLASTRKDLLLPRKTEVSLAVDYEGKHKDRWGKTTRINPHYHVSLDGKKVLWDRVEASLDTRFEVGYTLLATDGEAGYVAGKNRLPGRVTHLYDRYHVFKIVRDLTNPDISPEIIALLSARRLDGALLHLGGYRDAYRQDKEFKIAKDIQKLMKFLVKWEREILAGLTHSLGTCEGSNAHVIAARCKRLGRSWGKRRLGALCELLAHTHSGREIPKIRRRTTPLLQTGIATEVPVLSPSDNTARRYEANGNHYYHQGRFSDEGVASFVNSWKDEARYI